MKKEIIKHLKNGGVAVVPTDTLYGIVAKANNKNAVNEIYKIKNRDKDKPLIILISDLEQLKQFNVDNSKIKEAAEYWPGKVSVILPIDDSERKYEYLHRGTETLAFRMPKKGVTKQIISKTGPIVAPSANPQGKEPAHNIEKAKEYFGKKIKYLDAGELKGNPSRLISLINDKPVVLR